MFHIEAVRILDDHVYGLVGQNWYYICDSILDIEIDDECVKVKCESFTPHIKDIFTIILSENRSGTAVVRKEYLRNGDIRKSEFFTIKDVVKRSTIKVNKKPEYFVEALKRVRENSIERDWKKK